MLITLLLAAALVGPPTPPPTVERLNERLNEVERVADGMASDILWIGAGQAADLFSTAAALKWCEGCAEANPLGFNVEARVALKAAGGLLATGMCYELRRGGHHKAATVFRWISVGISAFAVGNNTYHAIKGK